MSASLASIVTFPKHRSPRLAYYESLIVHIPPNLICLPAHEGGRKSTRALRASPGFKEDAV